MIRRRAAHRAGAPGRGSTALGGSGTWGAVGLAVVVPALFDSACFEPANVSFTLDVPSAIAAQVAWVEIGAFAGASCPTASALAGGVAPAGAAARVVFPAGDKATPAFGNLPKGSYGFAAVARAADCSVVAEGCAVVNVASSSGISIKLAPVASPAGACEAGNACVDAVCVSQGAAGGFGLVSGCSLALVGGGPLADPLGYGSTLLSAPAIVATGNGFLLAYREFDPSGGNARLTLIPVDDDGAAGVPQRITLQNRCATSPESDATALAWSGTAGVVAVSRHACTTSRPGVDIYAVDSGGVSNGGGFSPTGADGILLSEAHALAFTPEGLLLAAVDATTRVATVTTINGTGLGSTFPFGDVSSALGAYVAGTSLGAGLLSLGNGGDAGIPGTGDGGSTYYTGSLTSLGSGASLSSLPSPNDFQGSWVSLGGVDSRILVATSGTPTSNPIVWYAYDTGVATPAYVDSFAPQAPGNVVYADVTLHADNAFFAAEVGESIALFAFRKASTYPELLVEKDFATDDRISIANVRDGLVAVAADATRVAVVWGTARNVSDLEDLGGYAVFACTP